MTPAESDDLTEVIYRYAAEAVSLPRYRRRHFYSIVRAVTADSARQAGATDAQAKAVGQQMVDYIKRAAEIMQSEESAPNATA